jgi:hypothetical protein
MVVVVLCILKGRMQRRAPLQALLFKHINDEQIQMKTDKKMAHVKKYLSLI